MPKLDRARGEIYDFELMEELNSYIVVSLVFPGLPTMASGSGQHFSMLEALPVTSEYIGTTIGVSHWTGDHAKGIK
jgi:hypothetical protein